MKQKRRARQGRNRVDDKIGQEGTEWTARGIHGGRWGRLTRLDDHCMQRGLATRKLSARVSVCSSDCLSTLNGVIALILRFFPPNSIANLQADYVTVVKNTPIMSPKYRLPVSVFHFWPKLTVSAARSLCDS